MSPAKGVGGLNRARVRIPPTAPEQRVFFRKHAVLLFLDKNMNKNREGCGNTKVVRCFAKKGCKKSYG